MTVSLVFVTSPVPMETGFELFVITSLLLFVTLVLWAFFRCFAPQMLILTEFLLDDSAATYREKKAVSSLLVLMAIFGWVLGFDGGFCFLFAAVPVGLLFGPIVARNCYESLLAAIDVMDSEK